MATFSEIWLNSKSSPWCEDVLYSPDPLEGGGLGLRRYSVLQMLPLVNMQQNVYGVEGLQGLSV